MAKNTPAEPYKISVEYKQFLDALEECEGEVEETCNELNFDIEILKQWRKRDPIFSEAIDQIVFEASIPRDSPEAQCTSAVLGVRPIELFSAITSRQVETDDEDTRLIDWSTVKQMCTFLGYLQGLVWSHNDAMRLSRVSPAKLQKWRRDYSEFEELYQLVEKTTIMQVYNVALKKALDPSNNGDGMRRLILRGKGHLIGFENPRRPVTPSTQVNVLNIQRTPEESDAILRAHQKSIELPSMIQIPEKT